MTDLSHDAADDGFHEIQLSGKQLVFLFMATTVVSVVIFLCGVLVGRGVRGEALSAAASAAPPLSVSGPGASTPPPSASPSEPPASADPSVTYKARLEAETPPVDTLKPRSAPAPAVAETPPPPPAEPEPTAPAAREPKAETPKSTPPAPVPAPVARGSAQPGVWAVQVVALADRAAANAVVQRLNAKGYPAFLVSPQSGAPVQNYKVQVGRFDERSQAEQIAGRLKKEEQFQPWILR